MTEQEKKNEVKKRPKNWNEVVVSSCFFAALFLGMIVYLGHFVATKEQEMVNNSYNSRQAILLSRNYRGSIYSRDGDVLAQTVLDKDQNEEREYPYGTLFSHIIGYSTQGRMGVEAMANYYLINTNTSLTNKVANDMAERKNPGDNVYTTLDVHIQQVADEQLNVFKGAIIVSEVSTGKVLAMVSHPNFDPNEIDEIWDDLIEDSTSSVLLNRATQGLYPPGSTFKIVTALEYFRQNPNTYQNYSFNCNGYYRQGESRVNCYHGTSHGRVDLRSSFTHSCNSSFANIGLGLDRNAFQRTLEGLLFNKELPLTMSYSKSSIHVSDELDVDEMMQTSFGQGKTQVTPMHMHMIVSAIANKGILMKPYVIDHVENDRGVVIKAFKPSSYGRLVSEEESAFLMELMKAVVEEGNGSRLKGLNYTAAGKTGSAEYNNIKGESHAWFVGYAPAEEPEVCVTVIVEGAGSGSDYALPIAKRLFDAYFAEKDTAREEVQ